MSTDPLTAVSTRTTPQNQPARPDQVRNAAGGHVFTITDEARLRRFLTLGTDGGTYYTTAADLTLETAAVVLRMAELDHATLRRVILEVSLAGRAPKQNPTLFALAIACSLGDDDDRAAALTMLSQVARTGTHLFIFARYVEQFRGWGRGLRRAVARWYTTQPVDDLGYQVAKYRQREGWTHRDLLRLSHPQLGTSSWDNTQTREDMRAMRATFDWITHGWSSQIALDLPPIVEGYLVANGPDAGVEQWRNAVSRYRLSWEMLPDAALAETDVWDALLDVGIPQTALIRQLPRLTRLGMLPTMGGRTAEVAARLTDAERLRKARVHPVNVLIAQRTYAAGVSARGGSIWTPTRQIIDALDAAFYAAFGAVEPAGKRTLLAHDVSGSMAMATIANMPLTPREASAALALVTMATEPAVEVVGFTSGRRHRDLYMDRARMAEIGNGLVPLTISPRQRLDDAISAVSNLEFGATDCAAPMMYALRNGLSVDTFVVFTDNETWAGPIHPHQALEQYRRETGIPAKLVVVGMTSTGLSIGDPNDAGTLEVAGFDSAVPTLIADFSRGF